MHSTLCIPSFFFGANPDPPLVPEIGALYKNAIARYNEIAREWTKQYAPRRQLVFAVGTPFQIFEIIGYIVLILSLYCTARSGTGV